MSEPLDIQIPFDELRKLYADAYAYHDNAITGTNERRALHAAVKTYLIALLDAAEQSEELNALFDLQDKRTAEADALYIAAHPKPEYPHGYRPDLGELICWLIERGDHAENLAAENIKLREAATLALDIIGSVKITKEDMGESEADALNATLHLVSALGLDGER